jgi:hypothetical protein
MQASKQQNKDLFMIISFTNHANVITEELSATSVLSKRFSKKYTLFKLIYFLLYLTLNITYHTLVLKRLFFNYYALLS